MKNLQIIIKIRPLNHKHGDVFDLSFYVWTALFNIERKGVLPVHDCFK